ncbi:hypothetical protein DKP78_23655, partial [Enterococcus faecium]
ARGRVGQAGGGDVAGVREGVRRAGGALANDHVAEDARGRADGGQQGRLALAGQAGRERRGVLHGHGERAGVGAGAGRQQLDL